MREIIPTIAMLSLLLASDFSAWAGDNITTPHPNELDERLFARCFNYFPGGLGFADGKSPRTTGKVAPFKLADMIAPADLVTTTEVVGKLPGYIRKYRGVWAWPVASRPPDFVIFVERLTSKEMRIAFLTRATEENKDNRDTILGNAREKLTWDGTAFSTKPEGDFQSTTHIYISAFGDAMLLVRANRIEAWPTCYLSIKHP